MYYLCKFSDSWAIYDERENSSRQLSNDEIEALKRLFPNLFRQDKMLAAIKIENINPNKLLKLPFGQKNTPAK